MAFGRVHLVEFVTEAARRGNALLGSICEDVSIGHDGHRVASIPQANFDFSNQECSAPAQCNMLPSVIATGCRLLSLLPSQNQNAGAMLTAPQAR